MTNKPLTYNRLIPLFFLVLLMNISHAQHDKYGNISFKKAINTSGKQRMLTQKMAKSYLYLLSKPDDSQAKKDLMTAKVIFEEQNRILQQNAPFKEVNDKIVLVNKLWGDFKKLIEVSPNYDIAKKIMESNTDLLKATNEVVRQIIMQSKKSRKNASNYLNESESNLKKDAPELEEIINIAGRQRMLSQRLALYYYGNEQVIKNKNSNQMLTNIFNEFDGALNMLLIFDANTSEIDEKIGVAFSKWNTIKKEKQKLMAQELKYEDVYKMTNELTRVFNDITLMYEKTKIDSH
ncbi:type IV pili methyl-accepting chemotaxis transducer N-terminal domain-containing protein [Aquimarina sp. RZ0]|uniref:type IV pili methyl-accepting chemotaxis transducer N-terminal domain-containing protein n=1 Tax=Aquimarina sp. RZ0 TaxID=2607730 RepID=UPI0011F25878|nr:type IV pili methyl-accepting chemotaxis transducer N-terminal domain-containing protein [Aquimarina sp. RZ0]KAA1247604.1 hypothetical protein F0000_02005 [Aquimarina sp. RZ0]